MKRALQVTVVVLSLLPLTFGTLGLVLGAAMYIPIEAATPKLDSQFRFMSAADIGLAFVAWWLARNIDRHTGLFRIVCLAVFLGGLGRVAAWYFTGTPGTLFIVVTAIELLVRLLIPWQTYVAHQAQLAHAPGSP